MNADLKARAEAFLVQCGMHDYGLLEHGCQCPPGDPRTVIVGLLEAIETLQATVVEVDTDLTQTAAQLADASEQVDRHSAHAHDCAELDRANEDLGRELVKARATIAELERDNAHYAGRAQSAEEQLAAQELETGR